MRRAQPPPASAPSKARSGRRREPSGRIFRIAAALSLSLLAAAALPARAAAAAAAAPNAGGMWASLHARAPAPAVSVGAASTTAPLSSASGTASASAAAATSSSSSSGSNTSMCAVNANRTYGNSSPLSQYAYVSVLVNSFMVGNFSPLATGPQAPTGILTDSGRITSDPSFSEPVNLLKYFNGSLLSTNRNGRAVSVNFLDDGGRSALLKGDPAESNTSNQYFLMTHLYSYFGALLGCSGSQISPDTGGATFSFPQYSGSPSMGAVHKFMDLSPAEFLFFKEQVAYSLVSFGADANSTYAFLGLLENFGLRCRTPFAFPSGAPPESQVVCSAPACQLAPNTDGLQNCSAPDTNGTGGVPPQVAAYVGEGTIAAPNGGGGGGADGRGHGGGMDNAPAIAGGVVGGVAGLALLVVAAILFRRWRRLNARREYARAAHRDREKQRGLAAAAGGARGMQWEHDGGSGTEMDSVLAGKSSVSGFTPVPAMARIHGAGVRRPSTDTGPADSDVPRSILVASPALGARSSTPSLHRATSASSLRAGTPNAALRMSPTPHQDAARTGSPLQQRSLRRPINAPPLQPQAYDVEDLRSATGTTFSSLSGTDSSGRGTSNPQRGLSLVTAGTMSSRAGAATPTPTSAPPLYEYEPYASAALAPSAPAEPSATRSHPFAQPVPLPLARDPEHPGVAPDELHSIARDVDLSPEEAARLVREAHEARAAAFAAQQQAQAQQQAAAQMEALNRAASAAASPPREYAREDMVGDRKSS